MLRFDGLYEKQSVEENVSYYLRFYPDGTVLDLTVYGTGNGMAQQVAGWFKQGEYEDAVGRYLLGGKQIKFDIGTTDFGLIMGTTQTVTYLNSYLHYVGSVEIDALKCHLQNGATGYTETREYTFVEVPPITPD